MTTYRILPRHLGEGGQTDVVEGDEHQWEGRDGNILLIFKDREIVYRTENPIHFERDDTLEID